jgi:hypothetical protein
MLAVDMEEVKVFKSQLGVVEKALETAALMLGTDKSRGYCPEMICADFLAGAALELSPTNESCHRNDRDLAGS